MAERKSIETVPLGMLRLSRFNPRKSRPPDSIKSLAERIKRNGFEVTRALWVYPAEDGGFEIFAGGTRFQAATGAGIAEVPVVIHRDHSEEEIVRLADEDNENDEYHAPVPLLDVWAECYRLNKEEGWTHERIAEAKGWDRTAVTNKIRMHLEVPDIARKAVLDGLISEGHCEAVLGLMLDVQHPPDDYEPKFAHLASWLTTETARSELVDEILSASRGKSTGNANITVANIRKKVKEWQKLIADADDDYRQLGEEWGARCVKLLAEERVRTLAKLNECFQTILKQKHDAAKKSAEEADKAKTKAEQEATEAKRKEEKAERIKQLTAKVVLGDALEVVGSMPEASLLLTDPPYGQDFQSGRRKSTAKKKRIESDENPVEAAALLSAVLAAAHAKLKEHAHVLVFTGWRHEPLFRQAVVDAGYEIKGSLVWVKNNHGTGDLKGSFAPRHERIIHAVKGKPEMAKRIDDVVDGKDKQNSDHPTEKPIDLLKKLIEATTYRHETVADPFAGSGSALFAAMDLERDFWGVEIDESYHKKIQDELYRRAEEQ